MVTPPFQGTETATSDVETVESEKVRVEVLSASASELSEAIQEDYRVLVVFSSRFPDAPTPDRWLSARSIELIRQLRDALDRIDALNRTDSDDGDGDDSDPDIDDDARGVLELLEASGLAVGGKS